MCSYIFYQLTLVNFRELLIENFPNLLPFVQQIFTLCLLKKSLSSREFRIGVKMTVLIFGIFLKPSNNK